MSEAPEHIFEHNRRAWDREVERGNPWTVPVSSEAIAAARRGEWSVVLTPTKPVPREWFTVDPHRTRSGASSTDSTVHGSLAGLDLLALASAGGQQAPIFAAAGAAVTVLDNSPRQLDRDREVAAREGLELRLELGAMTDLSRFGDAGFDLVFHPVSNVFIPDVRPVWRECFRVLRPGGALLAGCANPVLYLFDFEAAERGELIARHSIPYSDLTSLTAEERERRGGEPLEFGHTLDHLIGAQLESGFMLTDFYEDGWPDHALAKRIPVFFATRAVKPRATKIDEVPRPQCS